MAKVTKESLEERIRRLEGRPPGSLAINEEYQLLAYKMLLDCMLAEKPKTSPRVKRALNRNYLNE